MRVPLMFLDDPRLYSDYSYYHAHRDWPSLLPGPASGTLLFHCFWRGTLTQQHELSLRSLMATQEPPLEVWLWAPELTDHVAAFAERFGSHVLRCRRYVAEELASGTPAERCTDLLAPPSVPSESDVFRTLVLHKYGGVYFDLDVLFLKDVRPLIGADFFCSWSDRPYGNSAVIHLRQGSANAGFLVGRGAGLRTCHPKHLLSFAGLDGLPEPMFCLPSFVFDPLWIAHDRGLRINDYCNRFEDFFDAEAPVSLREFFASSYGYHWHNQWRSGALKPRSPAGQLYRELTNGSSHRI
jgi:hypothetical protein